MTKRHLRGWNLNEGYQPIITANSKNTKRGARPTPPKGGSGVPNLLHIASISTNQEVSTMQNNK